MKPEEFENQLRRHPVRHVPAEWRDGILSAARSDAPPEKTPAPLESWMRAIFWPHPTAWAGLAAAWVLIFVFNYEATDPSELMAAGSGPATANVFMALQQQQQEMAQMMQPMDNQPAEPPKSLPRPRGDTKNRITLV